jgi:hypothetical protein
MFTRPTEKVIGKIKAYWVSDKKNFADGACHKEILAYGACHKVGTTTDESLKKKKKSGRRRESGGRTGIWII